MAAAVIACPRDSSTSVTLVSSENGKSKIRRVYNCSVCGQDFAIWVDKRPHIIGAKK